MKGKITLRVDLQDGDARRFTRIKQTLGVSHNTEVLRYLINNFLKTGGSGGEPLKPLKTKPQGERKEMTVPAR